MKFDAALLAGGRSTRFGSDKACVMIDGQPLWQRQLSVLRDLGPAKLFVSGARPDWGIEAVPDAEPRRGAFSGFVATLRRCEQEHLLVLALDLPRMTSAYLRRMAATGRGLVPQRGEHFEPLAALYPKACLPVAEDWLRDGDASFQGFIRRAIAARLVEAAAVEPAEADLFANLNTPSALEDSRRGR